jgi:hypothetical protein
MAVTQIGERRIPNITETVREALDAMLALAEAADGALDADHDVRSPPVAHDQRLGRLGRGGRVDHDGVFRFAGGADIAHAARPTDTAREKSAPRSGSPRIVDR